MLRGLRFLSMVGILSGRMQTSLVNRIYYIFVAETTGTDSVVYRVLVVEEPFHINAKAKYLVFVEFNTHDQTKNRG